MARLPPAEPAAAWMRESVDIARRGRCRWPCECGQGLKVVLSSELWAICRSPDRLLFTWSSLFYIYILKKITSSLVRLSDGRFNCQDLGCDHVIFNRTRCALTSQRIKPRLFDGQSLHHQHLHSSLILALTSAPAYSLYIYYDKPGVYSSSRVPAQTSLTIFRW